MDELDHEKVLKKIIYKELEPSVLNDEIIAKAIYDQGPSGEAGRLFRSMEIQYDKVAILRLEFMNILRIDNLWILPNLRILSLAFNKIDKIENLDALTELRELNMTFNAIEKLENLDALKKLEVLNVFGNKIRKIENLDVLESLIIFSAGNNVIDTKDGLERLRFLKRLRSLNLKGNPVERDDKFFRIYIGGLLPELTYYEYRHIGKIEREEGKDRFRFKLREIMDNERVEVQEREKQTKDNLDFIHYSECFVEHLDKSQLFESLFDFTGGDEGKSLLLLNGEEQVLISEFRDQCVAVTHKIHSIGLEQFEKRKQEEKIYFECVREGRKEMQERGQEIIKNFETKRDELFERVKLDSMNYRNSDEHDEDAFQLKIASFGDEFNKLHDETWKTMMDIENYLHESVSESTTTFEHVYQDMMNEFVEQSKTQFVQLREIEGNFVDALTESAQSFVAEMGSTGREEGIPEELRAGLVDRDVFFDMAAGMREMHIQKIDAREDKLVTRSMSRVAQFCEQLKSQETERNRRKVMEINYFLDSQQIMYENLIADVGLEGEILKSASACDVQDENNDDTTMKTDIDNEEGGDDAAALDEDDEGDEMHHEHSGDDDDDDSRNDVEQSKNNNNDSRSDDHVDGD